MGDVFELGSALAEPGTVARGAIATGRGADGRTTEIPVLVCHGEQEGPVLWLNGGIGGDEAEGTFSIVRLFESLQPTEMSGTVVGVPAVNVPAFAAGEPGDPLDSLTYDLGAAYPGRADGHPTERVAWAHWSAMRERCDLQIAVRSGGSRACRARALVAPDQPACLELAAAMGPRWDLVLRNGSSDRGPTSALAEAGGAAITVTLGGNGRTLTSDLYAVADELAEGFRNVMRHYGMLEGEARHAPAWRMGREEVLLAPASGMWVGSGEVQLGETIGEGTALGRVYDLYGGVRSIVVAPQSGVVLGLRSRPAVLEGEPCCTFGVLDGSRDDLIG